MVISSPEAISPEASMLRSIFARLKEPRPQIIATTATIITIIEIIISVFGRFLLPNRAAKPPPVFLVGTVCIGRFRGSISLILNLSSSLF